MARAGSTSTTAKTKSETAAKKKPDVATKTYVLDTSVLLSDPRALFKFKEQEVVIPIIVINELEKKRHDPEIGYYARQALRNLDDLRAEHERLDFPIQVGDGGTLRVELNHIDQSVLPSGMQLGDNDSRILACAFNLASEGLDVTVVSKDLPMRVKAASLGMNAEENKVHVHDLHATILHLLGMDHEKLTFRHSGRDFRLTDVSGKDRKSVV